MTNIINQNWNVGCHTEFRGNISDTLQKAIVFGMYSTQFFMGNPQSFKKRANISSTDLENCKKILKRFPLNVFTHFPYTCNLAGKKDSLAWCGNDFIDKNTTESLNSLKSELDILSEIKGGVVIHPGNFNDRKKGLEAIAKSLNKISFKENSNLLLENSAGQGTSLCTTLLEIKTVLNLLEDEKKPYVNVCIDTCHLFSYGDYDFSKCEEVDNFFKDFDYAIGLEKLRLFHLNDSEKAKKSKKDRHALLGKGFIWNENFSPLIYLLEKCEKLKIPSVLETHSSDLKTLAKLK